MKYFSRNLKPRTKPRFRRRRCWRPAILKEVQKETGMYVFTEVATAKHVCHECPESYILTCYVESARSAKPICRTGNSRCTERRTSPLIKNWGTRSWTLDWCLERNNNAGLKRLGLFIVASVEEVTKTYRNSQLSWHIPTEPRRRRSPELPIFRDPSHIERKRTDSLPVNANDPTRRRTN